MRVLWIRLSVSNAMGEEVAVLVDGPVDAGIHEVLLRTKDLPAGLYFYRLDVGGSRQVEAMVIRK